MASLVGHALGAVTIWEAGRRLPGLASRGGLDYLAPFALALAPDLDVVLRMIGAQVSHRGPSHSILCGAGLALIAAGVVRLARPSRGFVKTAAVLLVCSLVHPLLDFLMGCGPPVPFFWPWSAQGYLSPVQLIPTASFSTSPSGLFWVFFAPRTWAGMGLELLSIGPLWFAIRAKRTLPRLALVATSLFGFALTWWIFN